MAWRHAPALEARAGTQTASAETGPAEWLPVTSFADLRAPTWTMHEKARHFTDAGPLCHRHYREHLLNGARSESSR